MTRSAVRALVGYCAVACVMFVPKLLWPGGFVYTRILTPFVLRFASGLGQLVPLALGALYAIAATRRLERGNRARPAWSLLAGWLSSFAVGEAILVYYRLVLRVTPPVPSAGDPFFLVGYALLITGAAWFAYVYFTSGLPVGSVRGPVVIALVGTVAFAALAVLLLGPIARSPHPSSEAIIDIAYPLLDFVVLVLALILVRMTSRFQGGRVWTVWGSIVVGFVSLSAADIGFAYFDLEHIARLDPMLDATFIVGYALTAFGAATQYELVRS